LKRLDLRLREGRTITAAMPAINLTELRASLPRGARLIGIDPGARLVGVALSDVTLTLASPYGALQRGKLAATAAEVAAIARKEGAGGLVVGLPLGMDGSFGPAAQAAKDWGSALAAAAGLPVAFWDERLSSAAVNRAMIEADLTRAKRAKAVDAAAAAWMLQAALDATAPPREPGWPTQDEGA
jgi:putative Holliday junction resolvase